MKKCKPIMPTPTLTGADAGAIIKQALEKPSKQCIRENEKKLGDFNKIFVK